MNRKKIDEGVSDKFIERDPNLSTRIATNFQDFERIYSIQQNKEQVFYSEGNWTIIKNPKSLKEFGPSVRGIIMENGDLYLELKYAKKIHMDFVEILQNKNIIKKDIKKNWGKNLPQQYGFLTVQRFKDEDIIAIGESNSIIYKEEDYKNLIHYYDEFLKNAKLKNPNINFSNKLVGNKLGSDTKLSNQL